MSLLYAVSDMSPIHIHNFELWDQDEPAYDPRGQCEDGYGIVEVTYWKWMPGDITLTIDTVLKKSVISICLTCFPLLLTVTYVPGGIDARIEPQEL